VILKFTYSIFIFLPLISLAQKTNIIPPDSGFVAIKGEQHNKAFKYTEGKSFISYILAVKPGYATRAYDLDSILNLNLPEHRLTVDPLKKPDKAKVRKKIIFTGFTDNTSSVEKMDINYMTQGIDLKEKGYFDLVTTELLNNNFKVTEDNGVFRPKTEDTDYALSGEIIYYYRQSKGLPGYLIITAVKWSLTDLNTDEVVCVVTGGGYSNKKIKELAFEAVKSALKDALYSVIIDKDIISYVYGDKVAPSLLIKKPEILISQSVQTSGTENYFEKAIQSSVSIKTGTGYGSGFLISPDGYVLTTFQTIKDSTHLQAIFQNRDSLPLKIVAFDKRMDVALCKINGTGYKPLTIDTASVLKKIGNEVYAIGTSGDLGLSQSISKGVVSGIREIRNHSYIQTDASLNSGNSGGLLMTKTGEIIGIVSSKLKGDGIEGLGFAIPVNKVIHALNIKFTKP
jgi:S1-C subfamily serine protease